MDASTSRAPARVAATAQRHQLGDHVDGLKGDNPVVTCVTAIVVALVLFAAAAGVNWLVHLIQVKPLALLFLAYHLLSPICYLLYRLRGGGRFDLIQTVESNSLMRADIDYAHFCHRRFLKAHWPALRGKGLRSFLRYWDHKLHALVEPLADETEQTS